jgi:hypothetical protein
MGRPWNCLLGDVATFAMDNNGGEKTEPKHNPKDNHCNQCVPYILHTKSDLRLGSYLDWEDGIMTSHKRTLISLGLSHMPLP